MAIFAFSLTDIFDTIGTIGTGEKVGIVATSVKTMSQLNWIKLFYSDLRQHQ